MLDNNKYFLYGGGILMLSGFIYLGSGCAKKTPPPPSPKVQTEPAPTPVVEDLKEKPVYVYSGDKYRDPFQSAGASNNYAPEAVFDPKRSTVQAIIFSPRMKSALVSVSGSGVYFIKSGTIIDIMGKEVKGYTAKVMVDRVIIMGEADNVFEIKIKGTDEEEKKS